MYTFLSINESEPCLPDRIILMKINNFLLLIFLTLFANSAFAVEKAKLSIAKIGVQFKDKNSSDFNSGKFIGVEIGQSELRLDLVTNRDPFSAKPGSSGIGFELRLPITDDVETGDVFDISEAAISFIAIKGYSKNGLEKLNISSIAKESAENLGDPNGQTMFSGKLKVIDYDKENKTIKLRLKGKAVSVSITKGKKIKDFVKKPLSIRSTVVADVD